MVSKIQELRARVSALDPFNVALTILTGFAFALRLWFVLEERRPADELWLAQLMYFKFSEGYPWAYSEWSTVYPIGYPWIIRALRFIARGSNELVGPVQAAMGTATVVLSALLARRMSGGGLAALSVAVCVGFSPTLVFYTGYMLTETSCAFFLTLGVWLLLGAQTLNGWRVLAGGAALGHPRIWLQMDETGVVDCPYCDRRYVLAADAIPDHH